MLGQTIIPIYLPMPTGGDATIPADEAQIIAYVLVGISGILIGFLIGFLLHDKIFGL